MIGSFVIFVTSTPFTHRAACSNPKRLDWTESGTRQYGWSLVHLWSIFVHFHFSEVFGSCRIGLYFSLTKMRHLQLSSCSMWPFEVRTARLFGRSMDFCQTPFCSFWNAKSWLSQPNRLYLFRNANRFYVNQLDLFATWAESNCEWLQLHEPAGEHAKEFKLVTMEDGRMGGQLTHPISILFAIQSQLLPQHTVNRFPQLGKGVSQWGSKDGTITRQRVEKNMKWTLSRMMFFQWTATPQEAVSRMSNIDVNDAFAKRMAQVQCL